MGNHELLENFFLFELGGVDVISEGAWLATLGEVKVNWKTLTMQFMCHGQMVEIKGDPGLSRTLVSPHTLLKMTQVEEISMIWVLEVEENSEAVPIQNGMVKTLMNRSNYSRL